MALIRYHGLQRSNGPLSGLARNQNTKVSPMRLLNWSSFDPYFVISEFLYSKLNKIPRSYVFECYCIKIKIKWKPVVWSGSRFRFSGFTPARLWELSLTNLWIMRY